MLRAVRNIARVAGIARARGAPRRLVAVGEAWHRRGRAAPSPRHDPCPEGEQSGPGPGAPAALGGDSAHRACCPGGAAVVSEEGRLKGSSGGVSQFDEGPLIANRRTLALPKIVGHWSLTALREVLGKVGAKVVRHGRYVTFEMAELAIPRQLFAEILRLIDDLRPKPAPT